MVLVDRSGVRALEAAYPLTPVSVRHALCDHPLLSRDALADAATRLPPAHVERRAGDAGNGGDFAMAAAGDAAAEIRVAGVGRNWIMLRFIEQLPEYRALLHRLIDEIAPAIRPQTGAAQRVKGFVFISAPGTHTPFHFDAEYNILFQIAGDKRFALYPPEMPFLSAAQHEAYHRRGENMLPWQADFVARGVVHPLAPGDALYVPYAAPHWVRAGAEGSVSLSLTWESRWSQRAAEAIAFDPVLRKFGLPAGGMPAWPRVARWRAIGHRIARRAGIA